MRRNPELAGRRQPRSAGFSRTSTAEASSTRSHHARSAPASRRSSTSCTSRAPLCLRRGDGRSSSVSIKASAKRRSRDARPRSRSGASTHDYPAPAVLAVFGPGELLDLPVQVMQRGPDSTLLDAVKHAPWRAPRWSTGSPHCTSVCMPCRLTTGPRPTARVWCSGGCGSCAGSWRHTTTRGCPRRSRVEPLLPELEAGPIVACHGDFHPLNVLVDGDTSMVIDWTDAALGDRHGDVARTSLLFYFGAALATSNRAAKAALGGAQGWLSKRYLRAYRRSAPIDPDRVRRWEAVHLLHGWAQILEAHDRGGELADRVPLELVAWIENRFESAMA